jgi:hypothetical protein
MKALIAAIALAVGLIAPAAGASWGYPGFQLDVQASKGRPGGQERGGGRDTRPDRRADDRHDRLSDDERRALHRDLDKANRELYRRPK